MSPSDPAVIGIDVGGRAKGFHAVALRDGKFFNQISSRCTTAIADWCFALDPAVIAIDAPCNWSNSGKSRLAERDLKIAGKKVHCFATPRREYAATKPDGFYQWVFNGELLYQKLANQYPLFNGNWSQTKTTIETFPHAVVCALKERVVAAKPKLENRKKVLRELGYDIRSLRNIDFIDGALCAVAANAFLKQGFDQFGDENEGIIIVPRLFSNFQESLIALAR